MNLVKKVLNKIKFIKRQICFKMMDSEHYIAFLRDQGVRIGKDCDIHKSVIFGSEPFLIKIGNNVRLS